MATGLENVTAGREVGLSRNRVEKLGAYTAEEKEEIVVELKQTINSDLGEHGYEIRPDSWAVGEYHVSPKDFPHGYYWIIVKGEVRAIV